LKGIVKILLILVISCSLVSCNNPRWQKFKSRVEAGYQELKDKVVERVKVGLRQVPFIKKYIKLPPAPKKLFEEAQKTLKKLEMYKADSIYPEEYENIVEKWQNVEYLYDSEYYLSARKALNELLPQLKELLKKVQKYQEEKQEKAWQAYQRVAKKVEKILKKADEKKRLKLRLYLWKLKSLIKLENYDEFYREIQHLPI